MHNLLAPHADIVNEQRARFSAVTEMSRMTAEGLAPSLIISGPAGVGKTHGVEKLLNEMEATGEVSKVEFISGFARPTGLYAALYENRFEGQVVVLDDCDSVFRDETALNILKAALDSKPVRKISWRSNAKIETSEGEIIPSTFEFAGSVIFLTNLDFDEEIEKGKKLAPHFEALISRSHYIDIGINDSVEKMIRVMDVCLEQGMFKEMGLKPGARRHVMNFMLDNNKDLREVSLRMAKKLADLAKGSNNWQQIAQITCLRNAR